MTKYISKIAFLAIVVISLGLMAWAVVVGASAPESGKIAKTMSLVGQTDENLDPVRDSLGKIVEVSTTEEGIEAMGKATIHQMRNAEDLGYMPILKRIENHDETLALNIMGKQTAYESAKSAYSELEATVAEKAEDIATAEAEITELDAEVAAVVEEIAPMEKKLAEIDARIAEIDARNKEIDETVKKAEKAEKETLAAEQKELKAEKQTLNNERSKVVKERKPLADKRKKLVADRAKFLKNNEELLRAGYACDTLKAYIALYELDVKVAGRDSVWAKNIEGVTGSQFAKESSIVLDYLKEETEHFNEKYVILGEQMAANKDYLEYQADIFNDACAIVGVETKLKPSNPKDEKSEPIEDYTTMKSMYEQAIKDRKAAKNLSAEDKAMTELLETTCTAQVMNDVILLDKLQTELAATDILIKTNTTNAETISKAAVAAKTDGKNLVELAKVINLNLYWFYFLMVFAVVFVFAGFILNLIQNPNWIKIGLVVGVVAVVCGLAYYIGAGHGWLDGSVLTVLDANGNSTNIAFGLGSLDSADRYVFGAKEYMLADVSIWITYIAFVLAALSAVFSWIWGIFKS